MAHDFDDQTEYEKDQDIQFFTKNGRRYHCAMRAHQDGYSAVGHSIEQEGDSAHYPFPNLDPAPSAGATLIYESIVREVQSVVTPATDKIVRVHNKNGCPFVAKIQQEHILGQMKINAEVTDADE